MALLLALLFATLLPLPPAEIIQVQIIHRHGARLSLQKHATDPAVEHRRPTLYPDGVQQLKNLGSFFRQRYMSDPPTRIRGIDPANVAQGDILSVTSNFERTQLSARAFLSTIYPDAHEQIPTLVFNGSNTDWIIRGYTLCPALSDKLQAFVEQDAYEQRENQDGSFVVDLARKLGYDDDRAVFANVFNVYDEYNIIHSGYDNTDRYNNVDKLTESNMQRLKRAADWYEATRFKFQTHKIHLAGGLLRQIMDHASVIDSTSDKQAYRIVHYSAHYPTLLTLLASLRANNPGDITWPADRIPEFGAALIIEVHKESGGKVVRMQWFQGGDGSADLKAVAMERSPCTDAGKGCKMSELERMVALNDMGLGSFCRSCKSTEGVCSWLREGGREGGAASAGVEGGENCSVGTKATAGAIGAAVGLVTGLLVAITYMICAARRKRRGLEHGMGYDFGESAYGNVDA